MLMKFSMKMCSVNCLTASLNECKRLDAKYMTYFCGEDEKSVLGELGFKCVGQYVLYIKEL